MRTDTNFAKTTYTHTHDGLLNTGYCLTLAQRGNMVNENLIVFAANPISGHFLNCLFLIDGYFVTAIKKDSDIVGDCVS